MVEKEKPRKDTCKCSSREVDFFFQSLFTVLLQYMKGHGRIRRYISPIVRNKKEPDQLLLKYLFFSLTLIHCLYYKFQNWCRSITCFHSWSQVILPHDVLCRNLNIYYAIFKIVGMKFLSKWSLFDFWFIKGEFRTIMGNNFWFLKKLQTLFNCQTIKVIHSDWYVSVWLSVRQN